MIRFKKIALGAIAALIYLSTASKVLAQEQEAIAKEWEKILANYQGDDMNVKFRYSYYFDVNVPTPNRVLDGEMIQKGDQYFYKLGYTEIMRSNDYIVVLDNQQKTILLDTIVPELANNTIQDQFPLDSFLQFYGEVESKTENGIRFYKFESPLAGVSHTEMKVNTRDWTIKSVEIFFFENRPGKDETKIRNKLKIDYLQHGSSKNTSPSLFKVSRYIRIFGKNYQPNQAYRNYFFMNNLD